jgi:DNA-binding NarL/FixJ family response regulator
MPSTIAVFHVDNYKIMRESVSHTLSRDREVQIAGSAESSDELLRALKTKHFDVLILDLDLQASVGTQTMNEFQICRHVKKAHSQVRIIAHSAHDEPDYVAEIFKAGALGFVSKRSGYEMLIQGVKAVNRGKRFICSETAVKLKNVKNFLKVVGKSTGNDEIFSSTRSL